MGPITRSMSGDSSNVYDKIVRTLDPIQIKVYCRREHLSLCRLALHDKYVGRCKYHRLLSQWKEYVYNGTKHSRIHCCLNPNDKNLPSSLCQTSLQLRLNGKKLLTFHLYHTTGKIRVQGRACKQWVEREFKQLQTCVDVMASAPDLSDGPACHS